VIFNDQRRQLRWAAMMACDAPAQHHGLPARRWAAAFLVVATAAGVLTACGGGDGNKSDGSKLPAITLSSGDQKVTSGAVSYLSDGTLQQASPTLQSLPVRPGATITVTTPQQVADRGWQLSLDNKIVIQRRTATTGTTTVPTDLAGRQPLVTILAAPVGKSNRASGLWLFRLTPTGS
jgi:hypothetical protein